MTAPGAATTAAGTSTTTTAGATAVVDELTRLVVLVGSVRAGRLAPTVASWFAGRAAQRPDLRVDLVDLATLDLPDDLSGRGDAGVLAARIGAGDAIVVVTPEYNHAYPGALKTAIDTVREEWAAKPVGIVSYGGTAGGLRAVEALRLVFAELHAVTVRESVSLTAAHRAFTPDGAPYHPEQVDAAAEALLDRLTWWSRALRRARLEHPFIA